MKNTVLKNLKVKVGQYQHFVLDCKFAYYLNTKASCFPCILEEENKSHNAPPSATLCQQTTRHKKDQSGHNTPPFALT